MKKFLALFLSALMFVSLFAFGAAAAYEPPTISEALYVLKAVLNEDLSLEYDSNGDGTVCLRDVLTSMKRAIWANDIPENENVQLFGTNPDSDNYTYNYCPSIMKDENGNLHVYYCTNKGAHSLIYMTYIDYIGYRKGTPNGDGTYSWSDETYVLSPSSSGNWDDKHNCDPSVIRGNFSYGGTSYAYLMAFLGCTEGDINDIGLAVANAPEGPWVKVGTTPIVDYTYVEGSPNNWGVGQPSLINKGGADSGEVWFFYTRGDGDGTRTIVRECDFSNLDAPVMSDEVKLENEGLVTLDTGARDIINNADFAYDDARGILYATSDCHPNPTSSPSFISSHFRVTSFAFGGEDIAEITYGSASTAKWKYIATVGSDDTSFPRNHNTGLVRDEYGHSSDNLLTVFYSVSKELDSYPERSYRIHSMSFVK